MSSKNSLDWEVPVETVPIPSMGMIYGEDSFFFNKTTVDIRAMTAKEEDILLSQAYIKKGTVIDELIKSCIVGDGSKINVDDLIAGDRNALCISIRITGYGPDYRGTVTCPNCGAINTKNFDLSNLPIRRLGVKPVVEGKNLFEFKLPVTKKVVHFRLMTGSDERDKQKDEENKIRVLGESSVGAITSNFKHMIQSIDGVTDRGKINSFIDKMPAFDSRKLRNFMGEIQPGIDMKASLTCDECEYKSQVELPISTEFFWPST